MHCKKPTALKLGVFTASDEKRLELKEPGVGSFGISHVNCASNSLHTMSMILPLLLLLQGVTVWIKPINGFSISHSHLRFQGRPATSELVRIPSRQAESIGTTLFATTDDDDDDGDDDVESSSPSDEIDKDEGEASESSSEEEAASSQDESDKQVESSTSDDNDKPKTFRERLKSLWWKNDDSDLTTRQRLAKMGLAAVLSYGWVSNVSYAICISLAWYGFSAKTRLSPLAPDQWKPFLAVYAGFFVFNNVIRPLRLGLSVAISTYFDRVVAWVQGKTKLSKSLSIALVVFLFNIVGTISLMCFGITLASLASGVPIFPGKAALK